VKERPILFSGPMVKAILDGRKTQTRRVLKLPTWSTQDWDDFEPDDPSVVCEATGCMPDIPCPYGNVGDRLWVREAHRLTDCTCKETCRTPQYVWYEADFSGHDNVSLNKLRPSIHMPRWASRISLEVTGVRVERLQDISAEDIDAEGVTSCDEWLNYLADYESMQSSDARLETVHEYWAKRWDRINGHAHPWDSNPWVWVIEFKTI
jgi:hypothetical protein